MSESDTHEEVFQELPAFALDAVDDATRAMVEAHLATGCDECESELEELLEGAANLAYAVAFVEPPAELGARLSARLDDETAGAERESATADPAVQPVAPPLYAVPAGVIVRPWWGRPGIAWGATAGIAAVFVSLFAFAAVTNVRLNDRVNDLEGQVADQVQTVSAVSTSVDSMEGKVRRTLDEIQQVSSLQSASDTLEQQVNDLRWLQYVTSTGAWVTPSFFSGGLQPQAPQGMLITRASGDQALLMVNGLAPAPEGSVYQVWLVYEGKQVPGSTFTVDRNGYAVVDLDLSGDATAYLGASVTVEPIGGSTTPSDDVVLIGSGG